MKAPLLACLALLLTALVPASPAENVAYFGGGAIDLQYSWSLPGASGTCQADRVHLLMERVNSRLAVSIQSGTRQLGNGLPSDAIPEASCPLVISAEPGVWVNPCQTLKGEAPVPATNVGDPYFYSPLGNAYWTKTVGFVDGGYVSYTVRVGSQAGSLTGSCRSGAATASWSAYHGQTDIGTDPSHTLGPHYDYACWFAHSWGVPLPPCPPLP